MFLFDDIQNIWWYSRLILGSNTYIKDLKLD